MRASRSVEELIKLFQGATERAAERHANWITEKGEGRERKLCEALRCALNELGSPQNLHAVPDRKLPVPNWCPRPGNTDLLLGQKPSPETEPVAIAELKVSPLPNHQPTIHEALYDAFKLAAQVGRDQASAKSVCGGRTLRAVEAAFLIMAAPFAHWHGRSPSRCPEIWSGYPLDSWHLKLSKLFPESLGAGFEDSSEKLIEENVAAWEHSLWGGSGRPTQVAHGLKTEFVARWPFASETQRKDENIEIEWELRCALVIPVDDRSPVPFANGWPTDLNRG